MSEAVMRFVFDMEKRCIESSEIRREIPDMDAAINRLHTAPGFHLLKERPGDYAATAWEIVHSRKNKDGTITQRLRPLYDVSVKDGELQESAA